MNLADIGKPAEITEDNVLELLTRVHAILDAQAVPRPWYIRIDLRRHFDKRQLRRLRRTIGRREKDTKNKLIDNMRMSS